MSQKVVTRQYSMSDADLKQKADALADNIRRDEAAFATRKIGKETLSNFEKLIADFDATSTDEEMLGYAMVATAQKDELAEAVRRAVRPIRGMAETAFGTKGHYLVFGFDDMANMGDNDLCRMGKRVIRVCGQLKADMEQQGLTDAQVAELSGLCEQLDKAIDNAAAKSEARDIETQQRINIGNVLYAEMMKLANVGKNLFEDSDEARYNDYVIIGSQPAAKDDKAGGEAGAVPPTE